MRIQVRQYQIVHEAHRLRGRRIERHSRHGAEAKVIAAVAVMIAATAFAASASARTTFVAGGYVGSVSRSHSFVARPGRLYRIELGPPERRYLGGWIVCDPGEALGYVDRSPSTRPAQAA
jgi:hypothetical protein